MAQEADAGAAMVVVFGPGFGRIPSSPPMKATFAAQMIVTLLFFVPLFIWDKRTIGRTHPATRVAFVVYSLSMLAAVAVIVSGTWAPIAAHLPGVGS